MLHSCHACQGLSEGVQYRKWEMRARQRERVRESHTQRLKVSCLSATVEKCEVGAINWQNAERISGRKPLNPWGIWESILVMKCHMTQHASRSSACGGKNSRFFTTGSRWLQNFWNKCLHILQMPVCHIKPLLETWKLLWKRKIQSVQRYFFYVTLGQMPESELVPSAPLPVLLRVKQVLCIIHHPLHMHRVACTLASRLRP